MTTKPSYTPTLRFPDFINDGEWEVKRLGEIAEFYKGKGIPKSEASDKGQTPCVRYGELYTHYKEVIDETQSFTDIPTEELFLSKANDVIIPSSGETKEDISTASCVLKDNIALGGDINVIRTPHNGVFLSYYLNNAKKDDIAKIAQGVSIIHLYNDQLKNLRITLPSIEEQNKIADCLTALDELIAATNEKLEQMKAYKKGLMQQLFVDSMGGGKSLKINYLQIPKLRFPEFYEEKEWEEKKLGECFSERTERNYNDLPLLSLTESDGIVLQEETNRKNNSNADKSRYLRICVGDIAYNTMRMWQGRCAIVNIEGIVSPAYTICKPKQEMDSLFFYYYFKTNDAIDKFHRNSQGLVNDTLNLKYESFEKIKMYVPSLPEQRKIASCLSAMDETINAYTEKVGLLGQYKKGLMQQMFPQNQMN